MTRLLGGFVAAFLLVSSCSDDEETTTMGTLGIDANDRVYAAGYGSELDGVVH